jgi:hypothetical protein
LVQADVPSAYGCSRGTRNASLVGKSRMPSSAPPSPAGRSCCAHDGSALNSAGAVRSGPLPAPQAAPRGRLTRSDNAAGTDPSKSCGAPSQVARITRISSMSGCSRRSPLDSCSWTPRGGSGSGPLARRGTATLVMANCTSRLAKVPRSLPLSRDRTRCPRCPASRGTTRCRHRRAVVARVPHRARPVVRIRPQVRPGALHPRARCRPARQDAADS